MANRDCEVYLAPYWEHFLLVKRLVKDWGWSGVCHIVRDIYFPPVTPLCPRRVLAALSLLLLLIGDQIASSLAAFRLPSYRPKLHHRIHTLFLYQCYRTPEYRWESVIEELKSYFGV